MAKTRTNSQHTKNKNLLLEFIKKDDPQLYKKLNDKSKLATKKN